MTSLAGKLRGWTTVVVAGLLLLPLESFAQVRPKPSAPRKPSNARKAPVKRKVAQGTSGKQRTLRTAQRSRRARRYRHRMAQLRLEPQRIEEIQRALIQAGYLNQEPTGKWDEPTRHAMQSYQQAHSFPTTGLPEAKSLMKLGLGPHPLPEDLDPTAAARASVGTPTEPQTSTDHSAGDPSASPPPPDPEK